VVTASCRPKFSVGRRVPVETSSAEEGVRSRNRESDPPFSVVPAPLTTFGLRIYANARKAARRFQCCGYGVVSHIAVDGVW
jgi:hypothetical protein